MLKSGILAQMCIDLKVLKKAGTSLQENNEMRFQNKRLENCLELVMAWTQLKLEAKVSELSWKKGCLRVGQDTFHCSEKIWFWERIQGVEEKDLKQHCITSLNVHIIQDIAAMYIFPCKSICLQCQFIETYTCLQQYVKFNTKVNVTSNKALTLPKAATLLQLTIVTPK